jgi:hypothetical protein
MWRWLNKDRDEANAVLLCAYENATHRSANEPNRSRTQVAVHDKSSGDYDAGINVLSGCIYGSGRCVSD